MSRSPHATSSPDTSQPIPDRAKQLDTAWREANETVSDALQAAGILTEPHGRGFGVPHTLTGISRLRAEEWNAHIQVVWFWERRAQNLEDQIRRVLACDLSTEHRASLMEALTGKPSRARDARLLTESEASLIQSYRETDAAGKQLLRTLLKRLEQAAAREVSRGE